MYFIFFIFIFSFSLDFNKILRKFYKQNSLIKILSKSNKLKQKNFFEVLLNDNVDCNYSYDHSKNKDGSNLSKKHELMLSFSIDMKKFQNLINNNLNNKKESFEIYSEIEKNAKDFLISYYSYIIKTRALKLLDDYLEKKQNELNELKIKYKNKLITPAEYFFYEIKILELENSRSRLVKAIENLYNNLNFALNGNFDINDCQDFDSMKILEENIEDLDGNLQNIIYQNDLKISKNNMQNIIFKPFSFQAGLVHRKILLVNDHSTNIFFRFTVNLNFFKEAYEVNQIYQNYKLQEEKLIFYRKKLEKEKLIFQNVLEDLHNQYFFHINLIDLRKANLYDIEKLYEKGLSSIEKVSELRDSLYSAQENFLKFIEEFVEKIIDYDVFNGKIIKIYQD